MKISDIALRIPTVLVAGYGQQGATFVKLLRYYFGFDPSQLVIFDRDETKRTKCAAEHPGSMVVDSIASAKLYSPTAIFNLVNTSSHRQVMEEALGIGVRHHFVEKPLVLPAQLGGLPKVPGVLGVGYIIRFSPALTPLLLFMGDKGLRVIQGRGFWSKDRTADTRPTVGDLEDEATHALDVMEYVATYNQRFESIGIRGAALTYLDFVNREAQDRQHALDSSCPKRPNSTSHFTVRLDEVDLHVHSCFAAAEVERRVEFALARPGSWRPCYYATLNFDVGRDTDRLQIKEAGAKECLIQHEIGCNKQAVQMGAFLTEVLTNTHDSRLVTGTQAEQLVLIGHWVMQTSTQGMKP